jgi:hypothetical protein
LGALSGGFVTEEGDLGCSEDGFHWVDEDFIPPKLVEEISWMSFVFLERPG